MKYFLTLQNIQTTQHMVAVSQTSAMVPLRETEEVAGVEEYYVSLICTLSFWHTNCFCLSWPHTEDLILDF